MLKRIVEGRWLTANGVFDLMLAVPKYGRVKDNKILSQCRISPSKTLGGLSQRQRRHQPAHSRTDNHCPHPVVLPK